MNLKHLNYFWKVACAGSVVRASEELHITPQTVSGQIQLLERELGSELFVRRGRRLELSEAGRLALGYAKEIFSLESELEAAMRQTPRGRPREFRVGVADAIPKSLAYRLLAPAMHIAEPVSIVCREWKLDSLLSELAVHRLDLVLADAPIPPSVDVRAFNHRLGKSALSFFAHPDLAQRCRGEFPACLDGKPMLLPSEDSAIRGKMVRWLGRLKLRPRFMGEFDGSSLMAAFGQAGVGIFIAPSALDDEICRQHGVVAIGRTREVAPEYFAISAERRVSHPCVLAVTNAARNELLPDTAD
jgi:LysR family transcriptional activator of nhaA